LAGATADGADQPWRRIDSGVVVRVHVTPKSSRDAIEGVQSRGDDAVLKVRVRAAPEDGKANVAVERLLAELLGLGRRAVNVTSGAASRHKSLTIIGDVEDIERRLSDIGTRS
jgi:uncharacterized protein